MLHNALDGNPAIHLAIEHRSDKVNAILAHHIRYSKISVHDFVDAVERVFLVDDGVKENTERPDVLLFAAIRFTC